MKSYRQRIAAFFGLFVLYVSPVSAQTWDSLQQSIRRRFPDVKQLSTRQLSEWLSETNALPRPILVDVRRAEEFAVSHLSGARNITTVSGIETLRRDPAQPIVVYCSVGYRSSALAEKLEKAGVTNVLNLDGSIFAWANEGRPLFCGSERMASPKVHPYDKKWGQLLKEDLRSTLP